jgi:PTS system nitrogen regulatory IIA component
MDIADLITPRSVIAQLRAANKRHALQELARRAAAMSGLNERAIYDVLIERERLGSTGIGMGVGIPHGKLPGLTRLYGIFARLERPIPFEAIDDQPVDLILSAKSYAAPTMPTRFSRFSPTPPPTRPS